MQRTKVVDLGRVRDLNAEWNKVREHILAQRITGFQIALIGEEGREVIYMGGVFKEQPQRALKTTLKLSAARMLKEDEPLSADDFPEFAISQF